MPKQAPPIASDDDINKLLKERGYEPGSITGGTAGKVAPATNTVNQFIEDYPLAAGFGQGVAGYAEAPAYYAEKGIQQFNPGFRMPLHDRAKDIRDRVESTPSGVAGEMAGTMAPAFIPIGGELGGLARGAMGAEDLARMAGLARAYRAVPPGVRGAISGGTGALMSRPATTPQEAWEQASTGALFGGLGGQAAAALRGRAAAKAGQEGMKAWSMGEEMTQAAEREEAAKAGMRYTGTGPHTGERRDFSNVERFTPAPQTEARTPKDILRERTKLERAANKREPQGAGEKFGSIAAKGAGFALGHLTGPPGLHRVMGHVYSAAFDDALRRMNSGEAEALKDYIDTFLSRRGSRPTAASRAGAAGGAFGSPAQQSDPTTGLAERPDVPILRGAQR